MGTQLRFSKHISSIASALLLGAITVSSAQAADQASDAKDGEMVLEEVMVTANKRTESVQEFAGSVTAISGDMFEANVINNMQDLRDIVPNLYLDEDLGGSSTAKIFIRGVGIDNPAVSFDSPVGIYVDGVYRARTIGALTNLYDISRVEFLRGPQGTLAGLNNSAGSLRIITNKPVFNEVDGSATFGYGTENQLNANAFWNIPLVEDKAALRLVMGYRNNDGFMTDTTTGGSFKYDDVLSGRAALLYEISDKWQLNWLADFTKDDSTGSLASSIVPAYNTDDNIYTATLNLSSQDDSLEVWGTSVELFRDGDTIDFTSITAYRGIEQRIYNSDADGTTLSLLEGVIQSLDESQFTEEAFFTSTSQLGGRNVDWTGGIYYLHEETEVVQFFNIFTSFGRPILDTQYYDQSINSAAAYGEADFAISDRVSLTGGLRYTDQTKDVVVNSYKPDGAFDFRYADKYASKKWTWKAVVDFAVNDDFFTYISAATGFRSGGIGINPGALSVDDITADIFGPEEALSYEAGFKSTMLNGNLIFNASYFYVEYESLQLAVAGGDGITVDTPDATVHGLEAELSYLITDGLTMNATFGTQNDNIKDSDRQLKNTPSWQGRVGLVYNNDLPGGRGNFTISGDVAYMDDYFASTDNAIFVGGYTMVNAMARWAAPSGKWAVAVSGRNLGDVYYPIAGFKIVPGLLDNQFPNYPRRWLAEVQLYF